MGIPSSGPLLVTSCAALILGFLYWRQKSRNKSSVSRVILFPDSRVPCSSIVRVLSSYVPAQWSKFLTNNEFSCTSRQCKMFHCVESPFVQLLMSLARADQSLDICVYVFTSQELLDLVIGMHKMRRIRVRVITDQVQEGDEHSRIQDLRLAGVHVLADTSTYYMHHKFCIVDGTTLLNGSFNWTRSAFVGNNENVIITQDPDIVVPFKNEFERLWKLYNCVTGPRGTKFNYFPYV